MSPKKQSVNTTNLADTTILIPSHIDDLGKQAMDHITNELGSDKSVVLFSGHNYPSFSKLINDCILFAETERVIICNHKARPKASEIDEMIKLLDANYGFVGLHNFRFFGFKKDLIRIVGWFDERYKGGGYEDFDFLRRVRERDIAIYLDDKVECIQMAPTWKDDECKKVNFQKWNECVTHSERLMQDELHLAYKIGAFKGSKFKPFKESVINSKNPPKEFVP